MQVNLIGYTPNPVMMIETAASKCYDSEPSEKGRIMMACYRSGHHSVLEHAMFNFEIIGVSRSLLAQLSRHRFFSFSVRSQRYCDEDNFGTVVPPSVMKMDTSYNMYNQSISYARGTYKLLKSLGVPNEDARSVLPNSCETELVASTNLRELIHFCNFRLCTRAQNEIRELAKTMRDLVVEVMPQAKSMLVPKCEINYPYCFCTESNCCGRHPKLKDVYDSKYLPSSN